MELMKLAVLDRIKDQRINLLNLRLDKMLPRVEIGFLVGYVSKNLYRIWFPYRGGQYGRVDVVRDTVFDETRRYIAAKKLESEDVVSMLINQLGKRENWPIVLIWDEA
ncbi:hypothetical protein N7519_008612 [Penicillium mononematosum]|uniref:uncharacterized protein n=1 Tax=Penicillium mononematosum TaxID=268346 RepID=UPI002548F00C|nr:uncharacterized protein N7519_008612 [Penicillium mononematosum]KAJ6178151.1 hypothetical protein N7519_008612 [Penicillium mononematosum]